MSPDKSPNSLIHETSPYLLQHAYNPVNWLPFGEKAFETARLENKPVLISIGYSACHWCHVMERESFEDNEVAMLMNKHFVNIKVDREERGDVDILYMQAVQLMTGQGGWPLNCFVLPDGRPFYGGTYFNKTQWLNILRNLADIYSTNPDKVNSYAEDLTNGIRQSEQIFTVNRQESGIDKEVLKSSLARWRERLDNKNGGANRAPKFPLPSNYQFLLRYAMLEKDKVWQDYVELTLTKMAFGGINDQLRGGFSRYSTDILWKVPHFEKMLYDNAQLASLYCEAYSYTKNELYKETALSILDFVEQEWLTSEGGFYSAYDADSEGEEGKYYVWNELDLKDFLGDEYPLFSKYYEINDKGYWEHGNYILMRSENIALLLSEFNLDKEQLQSRINACKVILKREAESRVKPALDDKIITSWNAMMCTAYAKAYLTFGDEKHRVIALRSAGFIHKHLGQTDGKLYRTYKNGTSKIDGFLEDYAFTIESLIHCYLISQDETFLYRSKSMTELVLTEFENLESELLYYTGISASSLIVRTTEVSDNVIPASNSQMAINLFQLGAYFSRPDWQMRAERMLSLFGEEMKTYGAGYSNWACLALHLAYPFREITIVGNNVNEKLLDLVKQGITNAIFAVHALPSELPLVKDKFVSNKTLFYVCRGKVCNAPVDSVEETLKLLA